MKDSRLHMLRRQLEHCQTLPFYRRRFAEAGFVPADLRGAGDLQRLPLLTRSELTAAFRDLPPHGGFYTPDVVRVNLSPSPDIGFLPVYSTRADLEQMTAGMAALLGRYGVTDHDLVVNAYSYHVFVAGMLIQEACERLGAACIPLGPGHSEQHAQVINRFGATVLVANASFAVKVAGAGAQGVRVVVCGGEPVSSVHGARQRVIDAFGGQCVVVDSYGLAEAGVVAAEDRNMDGMYVDEDQFYVEMVDPETGRPVPFGERGEIVVTHLSHQGLPLVRFRTGDLAVATRRATATGEALVFPGGVLGRTDNMIKVKGVKLYAGEVARVLAGVPGLAGVRHQLVLQRQAGADAITLRLAARPDTTDTALLRSRFKLELGVSLNALELEPASEFSALVVDQRFASGDASAARR